MTIQRHLSLAKATTWAQDIIRGCFSTKSKNNKLDTDEFIAKIRDWHQEGYQEGYEDGENITNDLEKDKERLDWLADSDNNIGLVQLPSDCVKNNLHSLRDAIDCAMQQEQQQSEEEKKEKAA